MTSFDDCPRFTWSLGWTAFEPRPSPSNSPARFAITSLAFMLVEVPEPVWKISTTKCSSSFPSATSSAAATMAPAIFASSSPKSWLVSAALRLISPSARMNEREKRRSEMGKFSTARIVEAP